jgi:LacI family transcriptional regulator
VRCSLSSAGPCTPQAHGASQKFFLTHRGKRSGKKEAAIAERIHPSVDGLILGTTGLEDEQIQVIAASKPLVLINREVEGVCSVLPDIFPGIDEALDHLESLGHTSIAYLSGPTDSWMNSRRWNYLLERAPARGMSIVEIGPGNPTVDGGLVALPRVLAAGVTAVMAFNDLMAIGLLRAAAEQSIDVPGRISIIGFDDIFVSAFTSPELTTVRTQLTLAGECAVVLALNLIGANADETSAAASTQAIITELVTRGSTRRAAALIHGHGTIGDNNPHGSDANSPSA